MGFKCGGCCIEAGVGRKGEEEGRAAEELAVVEVPGGRENSLLADELTAKG